MPFKTLNRLQRADFQAQLRMMEKANVDLLAQKDSLALDLTDADSKVERLEKELRTSKRESNHSSPAPVSKMEGLVKKEGEGNGVASLLHVSGLVWFIRCERVTHLFCPHL